MMKLTVKLLRQRTRAKLSYSAKMARKFSVELDHQVDTISSLIVSWTCH